MARGPRAVSPLEGLLRQTEVLNVQINGDRYQAVFFQNPNHVGYGDRGDENFAVWRESEGFEQEIKTAANRQTSHGVHHLATSSVRRDLERP